MFTFFFCLCPHPLWRFEEPEKNLLLSLGRLLPCYLMKGFGAGIRVQGGKEPGPGSPVISADGYSLAFGLPLSHSTNTG